MTRVMSGLGTMLTERFLGLVWTCREDWLKWLDSGFKARGLIPLHKRMKQMHDNERMFSLETEVIV
jgi:hypothetical protein